MTAEKPQQAEQGSLIRQKLLARLSEIPVGAYFNQDVKKVYGEVLEKLPEDLIRLLYEDAIVPNAERGIAETLKIELERFANNQHSLHVDDSRIVVYGGIMHLPTQSMMLNAVVRGDCDYKVYPGDTGWSLIIPRKFPNSSVIPTLPSSITPP